MNRETRGFYLDLIFECWAQDGEIPDDPTILAKLLGDDPRISRRLLAEVRKKFRTSSGKLRHKRVDAELEKARIRSENARNAANARHANAHAPAVPPIPKPISIPLKEKTNKKVCEDVERVFDHYHAKFKKNAAYKLTPKRVDLIKKAMDRGHDVETLRGSITAMSSDTWIDRPKFNDLRYAIAEINGEDKVATWASYVPTKILTGGQKAGVPEKGKDYGNVTHKKF